MNARVTIIDDYGNPKGAYELKPSRIYEGGIGTKYVFEFEYNQLHQALDQEPIDYKTKYENYLKKSEVVISQLRADRDRLRDAFDKIRAEYESERNTRNDRSNEHI
jgi:hypothetical protein